MGYRKILTAAVLCAAAACFSAAADLDTRSHARLGMALSYMGLGEYEEAAGILSGIKENYPDNETVRLELAKALGYAGNLAEADKLFDSLPPERETLLAHASVLEANRKFGRAREKYGTLLEIHPNDMHIREKLADVLSWEGDLDAAGRHYARILSEKPDRKSTAAKYADVLLGQEEYSEALKIYKDIGIRLEEDKQRYKNMGEAYIGLEEYGEAEKIFRKVTDKDPADLNARIRLADAYYGLGEEDKAEDQVDVVMSREPDDETKLRLAGVLASRKKHESAAEILEGLAEKRPQDYSLLEFTADVYLGAGRLEESEVLYRRLLEAGYKTEEIGVKLADVLRYQGKHEEAIAIYRKYIDE